MRERISDTYDDFGRRWAHGTSPLYEEWAVGIAGDRDIVDLIAALPRELQQPIRIFAAARWAGCPLAPFREWRGWLMAHWHEVAEIAAARSVQTNEVGRSATLLPPLSRIDGPLALLEVGAAAGLCLYPERWSYAFATPAGERRVDPDAGPSDVVLRCRVDDEASVPDRVPEVVWRRGIDLSPIDAGDPGAIDWLATLVWPGPDHDDRVARLRGAAAVVASARPEIVRGDLCERLEDVASSAPADATLVVFHSAVLMYLDDGARRRFAERVGGLGARLGRPVVWLSNETRDVVPGVDEQVPADAATDHRFVQTWDGRAIALAGQHGAIYETAPFRVRPPA